MKNSDSNLEDSSQKIIKGEPQKSGSVPISSAVIKNQIIDAEQKARKIFTRAKSKANEIVNEAEEEAEKIRVNAYKTGKMEVESELLENLLEIKAERIKVFSTIEKDMLRLSVKVAEKIIGKEISMDQAISGEIVLTAIRNARQKELLTVRVNRNDLAIVEKLRKEISSSEFRDIIDFVADQAVSKGGCIIESSAGTIDARLETQLRVLKKNLLSKVSEKK